MSAGARKSRGDSNTANRPGSYPPLYGPTEQFEHSRPGPIKAKSSAIQSLGPSSTSDGRHCQHDELLTRAEKVGGIGTWDFDLSTRTLTLSDNLCNLLGYPPGTQFQDEEYWAMIHHADRDRAQQTAAIAFRACQPYDYTARIYAMDGSVRWHLVHGVPMMRENGTLERVIGVYRDVTDETRAGDELRKLSQQLMRTRDDERRHVARELHESAGQTLAALKMSLARLEEELPSDCEAGRELLRFSCELADSAVREIRTISHLMHPPMLDEAGLISALRWYARGFAERSKIRVEVEIPEDLGRQPREIETTIFRVVQEALTNVHRYSGSRTAAIRLKRDRESIHVEIEDAGCGIAPAGSSAQLHVSPGVGIAGMRERIKELDGVFQIESAPGKGTTIRTVLPLITGDARRRESEGNQGRRETP